MTRTKGSRETTNEKKRKVEFGDEATAFKQQKQEAKPGIPKIILNKRRTTQPPHILITYASGKRNWLAKDLTLRLPDEIILYILVLGNFAASEILQLYPDKRWRHMSNTNTVWGPLNNKMSWPVVEGEDFKLSYMSKIASRKYCWLCGTQNKIKLCTITHHSVCKQCRIYHFNYATVGDVHAIKEFFLPKSDLEVLPFRLKQITEHKTEKRYLLKHVIRASILKYKSFNKLLNAQKTFHFTSSAETKQRIFGRMDWYRNVTKGAPVKKL